MNRMKAKELRLTGTIRERWQQYHNYVLLTLPIIEQQVPFTPELFACESATISGEDPDRIPWPEKMVKLKTEWEAAERKRLEDQLLDEENPAQREELVRQLRQLKYQTPQWAEDFKLNDVMVAEACITSQGRRGELMDPVIINMPLCRHKMDPKWRKNIYLGSKTGFPAARHLVMLVKRWQQVSLMGIRSLIDSEASVSDRQIFAWATHDAFISLQPFKDGNERTARLMMQLVRRELEIPPVYVSMHDMTYHRERIRLFRTDLFIPLMQRIGYLDVL